MDRRAWLSSVASAISSLPLLGALVPNSRNRNVVVRAGQTMTLLPGDRYETITIDGGNLIVDADDVEVERLVMLEGGKQYAEIRGLKSGMEVHVEVPNREDFSTCRVNGRPLRPCHELVVEGYTDNGRVDHIGTVCVDQHGNHLT